MYNIKINTLKLSYIADPSYFKFNLNLYSHIYECIKA